METGFRDILTTLRTSTRGSVEKLVVATAAVTLNEVDTEVERIISSGEAHTAEDAYPQALKNLRSQLKS